MKTGYFLVIFFIRVIGCSKVSTRCPVRWLERPEDNSCYRFWPTRMKTWADARKTCQARGGDLLKLNSKHEKEWIINEIKKYPVHYEWWIGLQRHPGNDSIWLWTDGTSRNESQNFISWGSGEPNNHRDSEDCAEIWDNLLNDKNCEQPLQFICERPKDLPMKCDMDNGWDDVASTYCYKFFNDKLSYNEAVSKCIDEDAMLLTTDDASSQQKLTDFLDHEKKATVWLFYQYDTSKSVWAIPGAGAASDNWWNIGIPDSQSIIDNDTLCSVMDTNIEGEKNWRPESCDARNSFVCKKAQGVCPHGWIQHKSTCYLLNTQDFMTWNEATGFCNLRLSTLLEIKNYNDWYYALSMIKTHYSVTEIQSVWLGVSGTDLEDLKWTSDTEADDSVKSMPTDEMKIVQSETKCGFLDNTVLPGTEDEKPWKIGDCGGSRRAICTVHVNQLVRTPPPQKPHYECPDGYILNGVICYRWNPEDPVDWYTAREKCAKEGADLVTVQSEDEQTFVFSHIQGESWIGLNDRRTEGTYKWLDTSAEVGLTYWFPRQPNNVKIGNQYSENCVAMLYLPGHEDHGKWVDYPCSYKAKIICQLPAEWNIALGKIASQSSLYKIEQYDYDEYSDYGYDTTFTDSGHVAEKAIDDCSPKWQESDCCARTDTESNPWWMVDLGTYYPIVKIVIYRLYCPDCATQFRKFRVFISKAFEIDDSNIVYEEQRLHIPAILILNLKNVTVGRYVKIDIPRSSSLTLCEVKIFQGESVQTSLSPADSNCITDSTKWAGDIRHTISGKACQSWVRNTPHRHDFHDKSFPDGTEKDAENFCRDPTGSGGIPWCYTVDPAVRWEFCPVRHCTSEVGSIVSEVEAEKTTDCGTGWIEDPNSSACYWLGNELLTWADAKSVCKTVGASLPLPQEKADIDFLRGKLSSQQSGQLFWLGVYYEADKNSWVSEIGSVSSFILDKLGTTPLEKSKCAVGDKTGNMQANSCFERNNYSCMKMGPFIKYRTSSDEGYKQLPTSLINSETTSSLTTYTFKFEFKGYESDGATLKLLLTSDSQSDDEYVIRIGPQSSISKLNSKTPNYSRFIPNLFNEDEYSAFWVKWTSGKNNGDDIDFGRGAVVGRNMFLQWTDPAGIKGSSVSIATEQTTSAVHQGHWRVPKEIKKNKPVATVNLALNKPAKQSSSFSDISVAEKAVDGCKANKYIDKCLTHTGHDFEPWWEVDLGQVYPIREVVIYRRGPECCAARLGYFQLIISMFSDSTLEEDIVYKSQSQEPPFIMHIPTQGKHGRYVKITIPQRKEYLELTEVEVYEDLDASKCGSGWFDYGAEETCYKFSEVQMDWEHAKKFCDVLNSAMVVPKTAAEQLFIYENSLPITSRGLNSKSVWLGLHDRASEATFQTSDGSALAYTDWGEGEPNNYGSGEDCGALRLDWSKFAGRWNDQNCKATLKALCKKTEQTTTTSTTTTTTTTTETTVTTTTDENLPIILSQGDCRSGWIYSPVSSSCLRIFKAEGILFYRAASQCIKLNSRLASIENGVEQHFIAEMIKKDGVVGSSWDALWVGGLDADQKGDWQWFMDNSTWHSSVKWSPGQPDNHLNIEYCVVVRTGRQYLALLNDANCNSDTLGNIKGYVCKYNLGSKACGNGWIYNGQTDACYRYELQNHATWNDALSKCSQDNGALASVASTSEQLFLKALISDSNVKGAWVGAHAIAEEGVFQWIDGTTWMSNLWAKNQPTNLEANKHCAMMVVNGSDNALGLLQNDFCTDKLPFICNIQSCDTGWEKFEGNCYLFSLTNRGWEDAKANCESEGGSLVKVDDEKENNFLRQKVRDSEVGYMWIGARYDASYGEHRWVDGSPMTFTAWGPGRPGSVQGCVDYLDNMDFLWNSHSDCVNTKGPYICEKVRVSTIGPNEPSKTTTSLATTTQSSFIATTIPMTTTRTTVKKVIGKCGPDWDLDPSSDYCYKVVIEMASWTEAQTKCSEEGGNLLSITSDQEQSFITGRLKGIQMLPEALWIGASDTDFEAGWKWIDDKPFAYLNWALGEPNNFKTSSADGEVSEEEDCAGIATYDIQTFGQWNDLACSSKRGYICKKSVDTEVTTTTTRPRPNIEETEIIEFYQKAEATRPDFESHDLYEMGVRPVDTFTFSVKTKHDAHILLQNEKMDFSDNVYLVIIGGWGGRKSSLSRAVDIKYHVESGLLSEYEYRSFWISWNRTTIAVGKSAQVGTNVFLTYTGQINDIKFVSVGTAQYTDANWRIPKGDKYYGCAGAGWLGYRDSCFLVVQEQKDWNEANTYCHKEGAELASISNADEQRFLFSQLPQDSYCFNAWNGTKCNIWAERGECDRNPVWMATHCHLACQHCIHNCRDKYHSSSKCLEWTRIGECDKNPNWMIQNCAMSCGVCQGAPTRGYWIGLHSSGMDQSYTWSDHSTVRFTHWNSHQPIWFNLQPSSCVAMFIQNGKWNDGQCTDLLQGFICKQAKMVLPITTKSPFQVGCSVENAYGYGAYCYVYIKQQKSWSDAQSNCNSLGGHLAYIRNMYTQAFVASELQNLLQDYWIGLSVSNGQWSWNGVEQAQLTMTYFDKTVNVDQVQDGCFAMTTYKPVGLWKLYADCSLKLPSICQIPREGFTTTVPTTTLPSTAPLPDCAETWIPYGQYCYKVYNDKQRWSVAQERCTTVGSSLVSIHDNEENSAVADMANGYGLFWIGLHDTDIEGDFVWDDGSAVDFLKWHPSEPNNSGTGEDCAVLIKNVKLWNDDSCHKVFPYICKIPRGKDVLPDPPMSASFPACDENNSDDGWVTFGEFCYFLGKEVVTWHDAKLKCRTLGSTLVSVHSVPEQLFVAALMTGVDGVVWNGFNDLDLDNSFSWSDGSVVDFTSWAPGQPNGGVEKCVTTYADGTWHDYPCNDRKPYICQKRKDGETVATTMATTVVIQGGCPSGFNYSLGNKCYFISSDGDTTSWDVARGRCEQMGGYFVSVHSDLEQDFIALHSFGNSKGMWLGMRDLRVNGRFDWIDSSRLDYTNWAPNEPSSSKYTYVKEPCVEMWASGSKSGQWNDVQCEASRGFICSSSKDSSKPILSSQCPETFMLLRESCYKVIPAKESWDQSVNSCTSEGGQLMTIVKPTDPFFIRVLMATSGQTELWLGGLMNKGTVQWIDTSSSSSPTNLDTKGEGCLYISAASSINADPCTTSRAAVCKLITGSTTTASDVPTTSEMTASVTNETTLTYTCRNNSWFLYDTYCYAIVYKLTTFTNTKCSKYGMFLASINSEKENFKIVSWILHKHWSNMQMAYPYFWIGLALQAGDSQTSEWADGSSANFINIDNRARPTQGCVMLMIYTGKWQVVSCTDKHFYLCKGHADIATTLTPTTAQMEENKTDSVEEKKTEVYTTEELQTTTDKFKLRPNRHEDNMTNASEKTGLSGGQIAGVIIGVIGLIAIICLLVYIAKSWPLKKSMYPFERPSLGFDNALFHKNQDTVSMN